MGVDLGPLIKGRQQIKIEELHGRGVAIDAYNALYQFLAVIRGEAGEPLADSRGRVTSHLSGLYYRTINLLEKGVKPVYVFDGKPPELKAQEIENRIRQRESARLKYEEALKQGDLESARTYAALSSRLRDYMVSDAKQLLDALGVPWVQAPSEGEAEAAYLARKGYVWASVSQDYDSLLFGSPTLIRNLTISGRRKLPRKDAYIEVVPEVLELGSVLKELGLTREQLVDLAILIGTDFNPDGIRGVGPVKAYNYIKKYGRLENIVELREELSSIDYNAIREIFLNPSVVDPAPLEWRPPDEEAIVNFLCREHDFSEERVLNALRRLKASSSARTESLDKWFG
ncbi:MAG: flap endonuclease-1 [Conexivisphaera sp.]